MNIHQVKIFYLVAQNLSITKAAKKMNLSQPSISIQIKDLEDSLNVRLFDRINRRIALTDAGRTFLVYAEKILNMIDEAQAMMSDFTTGDIGRINIGATNTIGIYMLQPILGEFKEIYPKAELAVITVNRHEAQEQILMGELDFAFTQSTNKHPDIHSDFFVRDELIIVCSPKHKWAGRTTISLKDLIKENEPMVVKEVGSGSRDIIEFMSKKYGLDLKVAMELSNTEGIKRAVEANLGIALLSRNVVEREVADKRLVALSITGVDSNRDFYFVFNQKRKLMPLMKKFYDFIMDKRSDKV